MYNLFDLQLRIYLSVLVSSSVITSCLERPVPLLIEWWATFSFVFDIQFDERVWQFFFPFLDSRLNEVLALFLIKASHE